MDWEILRILVPAVAAGALLTIAVTVLALLFGVVLAVPLALAQLSTQFPIRVSANGVVEAIRALPPLVLLLAVHYLSPSALGLFPTPLVTTTFVFTMVMAAFTSDVFRGAFQSIPKGLLDGARALGMDRRTLTKRVILPEIFRRSLAPINALTVSLLKMSSIASVIALPEITYRAQLVLAEELRPIEVYSVTALAYVIVVLPLVLILRRAETSSLFRITAN